MKEKVGLSLDKRRWKPSPLTIPHPRPVESIGLTPVPAQMVKPPLIEECKAHLECQFVQHVNLWRRGHHSKPDYRMLGGPSGIGNSGPEIDRRTWHDDQRHHSGLL